MIYIYGLKASNDDRIMYVGKAEEPVLRFCLHMEKDSRLPWNDPCAQQTGTISVDVIAHVYGDRCIAKERQ